MSLIRLKRSLMGLGLILCLANLGCTPATNPDDPPVVGACLTDGDCAMGTECAGAGCVTNRPTLYSHIQIASPLIRPYIDNTELTWRATHADVIIGVGPAFANELRAENPNVRIFGYFTNRYHVYGDEADAWAAQHGVDAEDFYLHYREDMTLPAYAGVVLAPGFAPGFVPGWNPNRQPSDPPASATARSQARVPGTADPAHEPWFLANLHNPNWRAFIMERSEKLIDGTLWGAVISTPVEGVIVDNAIYYPAFNEGQIDKSEEFHQFPLDDNHPYVVAYETFYKLLVDYLATHFNNGADAMANYGHVFWLKQPDRLSKSVQSIVGWAWGEVWMSYRGTSSPLTGGNRPVQYDKDYGQGIVEIIKQTRAGGRRVLGARDLVGGGVGSDRGRLYTLALYYLAHNPNTYYVYESINGHLGGAHISTWQTNDAVVYDIGQPALVPAGFVDFEGKAGTKEHYEFATGADPFDSNLTYHVLARKFTNGIVMVKMLPSGSVVDSRSETPHTLDDSYAILRPDGTPGQIVTQVTLRNNEGVILVKP